MYKTTVCINVNLPRFYISIEKLNINGPNRSNMGWHGNNIDNVKISK